MTTQPCPKCGNPYVDGKCLCPLAAVSQPMSDAPDALREWAERGSAEPHHGEPIKLHGKRCDDPNCRLGCREGTWPPEMPPTTPSVKRYGRETEDYYQTYDWTAENPDGELCRWEEVSPLLSRLAELEAQQACRLGTMVFDPPLPPPTVMSFEFVPDSEVFFKCPPRTLYWTDRGWEDDEWRAGDPDGMGPPNPPRIGDTVIVESANPPTPRSDGQ